ncbi:MAG: hypothetical protein HZA48_00755 [Planctomycetes bacterium]|nr:hypothetical protein [Planctomycetota bacterium]
MAKKGNSNTAFWTTVTVSAFISALIVCHTWVITRVSWYAMQLFPALEETVLHEYVMKNCDYRFLPDILEKEMIFFETNTCCNFNPFPYSLGLCARFNLLWPEDYDNLRFLSGTKMGAKNLNIAQKEWLFAKLNIEENLLSPATSHFNKSVMITLGLRLRDDRKYWEEFISIYLSKQTYEDFNTILPVIERYKITSYFDQLIKYVLKHTEQPAIYVLETLFTIESEDNVMAGLRPLMEQGKKTNIRSAKSGNVLWADVINTVREHVKTGKEISF